MKSKKAISMLTLVTAFIIFANAAFAQAAINNEDKITAFKNIRIFDGKQIINECTVIIKGTQILQVGKNITVPKEAEIITGEDLTLLPGLIDSHVHAFSWGDLRLEAIFGATTVMDMMTSTAFMRQTKAKLRANGNSNDMADFYSAGQPATYPGGHGTEWGTEIPTLTKPQEAKGFIESSIASGSDYIKIMSGEGKKVIGPEVIAALADEARKRNLLTVVHIQTRQKALEAIKTGVNGLAHCFADILPDDEFVRIMKEKGTFVIPTLSVMNTLEDARRVDITADERFTNCLTPEVINALASKFKKQKNFFYRVAEETVHILHDAGIRVLAGSDSYNPGTVGGASLHGELELLTYAGLTPQEALVAATSLPAETFGLKDRGRIENGLRADLLLIKGDPTKDITETRNIKGVWLQGKKLDRDSYLSEIKKQNKEWKETGEIPAPLHSESGEICNFDSGDFSPNFGLYFFELSDKMMGGSSEASISLATDGADGTAGSLKISGNISNNSPYPWAGAAFFPGALESSTANLLKWNALSFWAKGDTANCMIMFLLKNQQMPAFQSITIASEWNKYEIPFEKLGSPDGKNIMAMIFGANTPGKFSIQIDQVKIINKTKL
jgi:imidazolonepropionase-like amidohydrolase